MSQFEILDKLIDQLKRIREIFTKNPSRQFKSEYILNKITLRKDIQTQFSEALKLFDEKDKVIIDSKIEKFKDFNTKLSLILDQKSKEILNTSTLSDDNTNIFKEEITMEFDMIKTTKIIPDFKGDLANFDNFCNMVEYVYDTLSADSQPKLLEFVVRTKIPEKIRSKLTVYPKPTTFPIFKDNFSKVLKTKRSTLTIQSELSRVKQGNISLTDFSSKIENLLAELNYVQIAQQGENFKDIIIRINDEIALNAFKNGLNDSLRVIIFASRPKNLNDAINLALEADIPSQNTENVLAYNSNTTKKYEKKHYNASRPKFCNYCKKKGHEIKDCYRKKNADSKKVNYVETSENEFAPEDLPSGSPQ